ncbi:universal stress protein [Nocardia salmonicida]|uniref:universal stress protein n=1 Tax=Nocardia salmonicida TaxID=53431 RepID=UPI0037A91827
MTALTTRPVVVGVDGSASALSAVRWAARTAMLRGAPLHAAPGDIPSVTAPPTP